MIEDNLEYFNREIVKIVEECPKTSIFSESKNGNIIKATQKITKKKEFRVIEADFMDAENDYYLWAIDTLFPI